MLKFIICVSICFKTAVAQGSLIPAYSNIDLYKNLDQHRVQSSFPPADATFSLFFPDPLVDKIANSQFGKFRVERSLRNKTFRYNHIITTQLTNKIERCALIEIRGDTLLIEYRHGWNETTLLPVSIDNLTAIQINHLPPMLTKGPGICGGLILGMVIGANLSIAINETYENGMYWLFGGIVGSVVGAYKGPQAFTTRYNLESKTRTEKQLIIKSLFL